MFEKSARYWLRDGSVMASGGRGRNEMYELSLDFL
jgi:hypothetical protein